MAGRELGLGLGKLGVVLVNHGLPQILLALGKLSLQSRALVHLHRKLVFGLQGERRVGEGGVQTLALAHTPPHTPPHTPAHTSLPRLQSQTNHAPAARRLGHLGLQIGELAGLCSNLLTQCGLRNTSHTHSR